MAKLTEEQVKEIKMLLNRGYSQADIHRDFKVSRNIVSDIANKKTWTYL
jgi:transcriptional regulator